MVTLTAVELTLLTAAGAVLLAALAVGFAFMLKQRFNVQQAQYEQRFVDLEKRLKLATSGAAGMGQRILALENKLQQLQQRSDTTDASDGAIAYTQAMQLFEQGVDADTIATSCGLSNAEASLMAMIHQHKSRAA